MKINNLKELIFHYRDGKVILWGSHYVGYYQVTDLDLIMDLKTKSKEYRYYLNKDSKIPHHLDNSSEFKYFYAIDRTLLGYSEKRDRYE